MTREEAIEKLKGFDLIGSNEDIEFQGALDIAIKSLEQEPCEDAISRQDVLDLATKGVIISNGNYESVCKAINELPSVIPKGVTVTDFADKCRECGREKVFDKIYDDIQKLRGCSCWCSDGIIDDVEDIIDNYRSESEDKK